MSRIKTEWQKNEARLNLMQGEAHLQMLVAQDYRVEQLSEYHFRINERLNVWPSTRKYYDANSQKKGTYKNILALVEEFPSLQ